MCVVALHCTAVRLGPQSDDNSLYLESIKYCGARKEKDKVDSENDKSWKTND